MNSQINPSAGKGSTSSGCEGMAGAHCVDNQKHQMTTLYEGLSNKQLRSAIFERDDQLRRSVEAYDQLKARVVELEDMLKTGQVIETFKALEKCAQRLTHYEYALKEAKWLLEKTKGNMLVFSDRPSLEWFDRRDAALTTINKALEQ